VLPRTYQGRRALLAGITSPFGNSSPLTSLLQHAARGPKPCQKGYEISVNHDTGPATSLTSQSA